MIDNIKLFEFSSKNKEPYIDKYYVKDNEPIITRDPGYSNDLMSANLKVIENITAYKIATEAQNSEMQEVILRNIIDALNVSGINFSEFTSYWAIKDMSHSVYKNTLITEELKNRVLYILTK